jgi:hypothetical protein
MRNTRREQMPSALLPNSDIARRIRHFVFVPNPEVEEILNNQDAEALGAGKLELTEAYYALAEELGRNTIASSRTSKRFAG